MADKYLIGAPVQGQNKPTPLREGDNILNAHLLVGEAGQVAPNIYIVRDEKYVRYDTLTEAKNDAVAGETIVRSEEHTSELQSRGHLVCRLLLEKKNRSNNKGELVK